MTEKEAEVLTMRLVRVWGLEVEGNHHYRQGIDEAEFFLVAPISHQVQLNVNASPSGEFIVALGRSAIQQGHSTGCLLYHDELKVIKECGLLGGGTSEEFAQFADEWMPFFRRGCWLSGCDIKASAHEKAEWMQGFTIEEAESWNLKF